MVAQHIETQTKKYSCTARNDAEIMHDLMRSLSIRATQVIHQMEMLYANDTILI